MLEDAEAIAASSQRQAPCGSLGRWQWLQRLWQRRQGKGQEQEQEQGQDNWWQGWRGGRGLGVNGPVPAGGDVSRGMQQRLMKHHSRTGRSHHPSCRKSCHGMRRPM